MTRRHVAAVALAVGASFMLGLWTRPRPSRGAVAPTPVAARVVASEVVAPGEQPAGPEIRFIDPTARRATPVLSGPGRIDAMEAQALGVSPEEMFEAQRRDEAWASVVERFYLEEYGRYLRAALGDVSELRVSCKESICEIAFEVPVADKERAFRRQQYMPTGSLWKPFSRDADRDGVVTVGTLVTLGDDVRDPGDLRRFYGQQRDERFPPGRDVAEIIAEWERSDGL